MHIYAHIYLYKFTKDKCDVGSLLIVSCFLLRSAHFYSAWINEICGELRQSCYSLPLSFSRIPAITSRISRRTENERGGGLLLSFVQRSRFDADAWRCLDIDIVVVVVVVATSRNLPWEMREVYSRIASPLGKILTGASRRISRRMDSRENKK